MGMLTLDDIINVSFRKANFGGYRPEDVDAFIDNVQESYDHLQKENSELLRKLKILAAKVEEYREQEESIRNTLLSAQKLADASVREAKHKAEVIITDATIKAEHIVANANREVEEQENTIESLQKEVISFRSKLLTIYKEHLTLIDALPCEETFKRREEKPAEETPDVQPQSTPQEQEPAEAEQPAPEQPQAGDYAVPDSAQEQQEVIKSADKTEKEADIPQKEISSYSVPAEPASRQPEPRFGALKFGESYDLHEDGDESPLGLFGHRNGKK